MTLSTNDPRWIQKQPTCYDRKPHDCITQLDKFRCHNTFGSRGCHGWHYCVVNIVTSQRILYNKRRRIR